MQQSWPFIGRDQLVDRSTGAVLEGRSMALVGPAGVGKTRALDAIASRLEVAGRPSLRFRAMSGLHRVNLSLFATTVNATEEETADPVQSVRAIERMLVVGEPPPVVIVDDAHDADDLSIELLLRLVELGPTVTILGLRESEVKNSAISELWATDRAERVELTSLDRSTVIELVSTYLDGPLAPDLREKVWRLTGGHPLFVHELVIGALESGLLTEQDGSWTANGRLVPSTRLQSLIQGRISRTDEPTRNVVDTLAAAGRPLPIDLVVSAVGDEGLGAAEEHQWIRVDDDFGTTTATLAHPLYAEVVREELVWSRKREVLTALLQAAADRPEPIDPVLLALWHLDAGLESSTDVLVAGAQRAIGRFDLGLADKLARRAVDVGGGFDAELIVANVELATTGDATSMDALVSGADSDAHRMRLALVYGRCLAFQQGDLKRALAVLESVAEEMSELPLKRAIESERAIMLSYVPDLKSTLDLSEKLLAGPALDPSSEMTCLASASVSNAFMGRSQRAIEVYERWQALFNEALHVNVAVPRLVAATTAIAYHHRGDLDKASSIIESNCRELDLAGEAEHAATLDFNRGIYLLHAGRVQEGCDILEHSLDIARRWDPFNVRPFGFVALAYGRSLQHRLPEAAAVLAEAGALAESIGRPAESLRLWAAVWHQIGLGSIGRVPELINTAVAEAENAGMTYYAAVIAHDFTRLGDPTRSLALLDRLLEPMDDDVIPQLYLRHARSLRDGDSDDLAALSHTYEARNRWIEAAEAAAQAASVAQEQDEQAAMALRRRSTEIRLRIGIPPTPAMTIRGSILTPREHEVARLAAAGLTSRVVAERLDVSKRTVDNVLASIYSKLGVRGRAELDADAFGVTVLAAQQ